MHELFPQPLTEHKQTIVSHLEKLQMSPRSKLSTEKVMTGLNLLRCATAEMLIRLLSYSPNTLGDMQLLLKSLAAEQLVEIDLPKKQTAFGRAPYVYFIGPRGRRYLQSLGEAVSPRYRNRDNRLHEGEAINHSLAVADLLIQAQHLEWYIADIWLEEHLHEWDLNAKKFVVSVSENKQQKQERFAADLLLRFAVVGNQFVFPQLLLPEIYTTRINERAWKRKVRAYAHAFSLFQEQYGVTDLLIPVINARRTDFPKLVTEKIDELQDLHMSRQQHNRHKEMIRWTEEEMARMGYAEHADIFYFSTIRHNRVSFKEFWFSPHWSLPYRKSPVPLIRRREGSGK